MMTLGCMVWHIGYHNICRKGIEERIVFISSNISKTRLSHFLTSRAQYLTVIES